MDRRSNLPLSEQIYLAGVALADAENAAHMLEETKTAVLSQRKMRLIAADPKLSDARAETLVKASDEWRAHIEDMVAARHKANLLKCEKERLRDRFWEWNSSNADQRMGARIS